MVARDAFTRRELQRILLVNDYRCTLTVPEAACNDLAAFSPELVLFVLEGGCADADADAEALRGLRAVYPAPLLVVSGDPDVRAQALDDGADDCVAHPLVTRELLARIAAGLRRRARELAVDANVVVEVGGLRIDTAARCVTLDGKVLRLTSIEYRLVAALASTPGVVRTPDDLLVAGWGQAHPERRHYVRVYIAQLRRKLEALPARPRYVVTVPGVGYLLRVVP